MRVFKWTISVLGAPQVKVQLAHVNLREVRTLYKKISPKLSWMEN